ncbi:MAG: HD domain-containing protein [Eubacteriales bacterium]
MACLTLEDIRSNEKINYLVNYANRCLEQIGYTDHGPRHVGYVSRIAGKLLSELDYPERRVELAKIAGWVHDVGNMINRNEHGLTGATMLFSVLNDLNMDIEDVCDICSAVGSHEEQMGKPVSDISAALIIADKIDAYKARVRANKYDPNDIHDRVNYSIQNTNVIVDKNNKTIMFDFTMDATSSIMEFMQLYLTRMKMCEESAKFLGCSFILKVNGTTANRLISVKGSNNV